MSVAAQSEVEPTGNPAASPLAQPFTGKASKAADPAGQRRSIRPLLELAPFVARYRGRAVAALVALVMAAGATLVVPVAVRRMIDNGFDHERAGLIDQYFGMMILV